MPSIRVISFDVHATLILPKPSVGEIYASYAKADNHSVSAEALEQAFLPAFKDVRAHWTVAYGAHQEDARAFWFAVIKRCFQRAADIQLSDDCCERIFIGFGQGQHWYVLDNVISVLEQLQQMPYELCICSNFDERVHGILKDLALDKYFKQSFISAELGMAKPDPRIMQRIAEHYQCNCNEILHIGNHHREDGELCSASGAQWLEVDQRQGKKLFMQDILRHL